MSNQENRNARDIQGIIRSLSSLESTVENLVKVTAELSTASRENNRTNWATLASWMAVTISIIGSIGYLAKIPLDQKIAEGRQTDIRQYDYFNTQRERITQNRINIAVLEAKNDFLKEYVKEIKSEQSKRSDRVYLKK